MINAVNEFLDDLRGGRMTESPVVRVEQGRLQGRVANTPAGRGYFAFQGIPYAKPPLGSLRFKDPQPHEPWDDVRDATTEGNIAPQIEPTFTKAYAGDENCLYLNVYSPTLDGSFLPVMVYIHGGGLQFGSGGSDMYGADYLIEKDVVVVTINYRLGALGFLCLNTPEVPGNAGLKDVILALKWVKENIHNFGGNPGNLTVFGESAGGAVVSLLTASPLSKNLISRAICQSGTGLMGWAQQKNPIDNARKLAKALGCEAENVDEISEFLSATTAKELVQAQASLTSFENILETAPDFFSVVVEKEFPGVEAALTEPFLDLLTSGRVAQVPIMVGTTTLEFAFEKKSDDLQVFIPEELYVERNSEISLSIADDLKALYFTGDSEFLDYNHLLSDRFMNVDAHRYIQYLLHSSTAPVYFYKFDYVGALNIASKAMQWAVEGKAMHLDDVGYLFKNDFQKDVEPSPQDLKMRERMVRLWTNFAKTGNPTPEENHYITVAWPPVDKDSEHYLLLGPELTVGANYDKEKMDYWDGLYSKFFRTWDQPSNNIETPRKEPVIVETLTVVTSSDGGVTEVIETVSQITESNVITSETVVTSSGVVETNVVETNELVESEPPLVTLEAREPHVENVEKDVEIKPHLNGNGVERKVRTSNEIKMVQSANGVPKDVIRANDPPEDDLPKNIGVNKFVNFFESLGGKK